MHLFGVYTLEEGFFYMIMLIKLFLQDYALILCLYSWGRFFYMIMLIKLFLQDYALIWCLYSWGRFFFTWSCYCSVANLRFSSCFPVPTVGIFSLWVLWIYLTSSVVLLHPHFFLCKHAFLCHQCCNKHRFEKQ
jgi:hypothetical protein